MTTQGKLQIAAPATGMMLVLDVFSKPLHVPEVLWWALVFGTFVLLGFMFHWLKKQRLERQQQYVSGMISEEDAARSVRERQHRTRKGLITIPALSQTSKGAKDLECKTMRQTSKKFGTQLTQFVL